MEDLIKELRKGNDVCCEDCLLYIPINKGVRGFCRKPYVLVDEDKGIPYMEPIWVYGDQDACTDFVKK